MHYYQFNIGDYAVHTAHLEPLEDLAYRRLLDLYYLSEKPIPLDIESVSRLVRMRPHSDCIAFVLSEFFLKTSKGFVNKRADNEIASYKGKSDKASVAAKARWDKEKEKQRLKRDADALHEHSGRNAKHKTLTTKQETVTNKDITPAAKSSMVTFTQWIDGLNESGEDAIPADHSIFEKAQAIGISRDYLALAWYAFRRNYTNEASKSFKKKYAGSNGWRRVFVTAVMEDWLKLWQINGQTNEYYLTTKGKQLMQEMNNENV